MVRMLANLCFLGSFLAFGLGTLGLFRFPDSYTRIHAVGMGNNVWGRFTRTGALFTQSQLVAPPEAGGDSPPVLADKPDHVAFGGESRSDPRG